MWGKMLNAGQTCIAPDYLLVHASVRERLFELMRRAVARSYGTDPMASPHYGRIVNDAHFERLSVLLQSGDVVFGGETDASERYVAPTLLETVALDDPVMEEKLSRS
jgi:aldehyde dehydrogenase (NAD+)